MTDEVKKAAEEWINAEYPWLRTLEKKGEWNSTLSTASFRYAFLAGHAHAMRWVPVSERLPEVGTWVLRYSPNKGTEIDKLEYVMASGETCFWGDREFNCYDATHWMPLPPLPKEQP